MTFAEARLSLQLEAEERLGTRARVQADLVQSAEDEAMEAARRALGGR